MKKKAIVTGGLGFIGSNLISLLLSRKFSVINLDKITYSSNFYNTRNFKIIIDTSSLSVTLIIKKRCLIFLKNLDLM